MAEPSTTYFVPRRQIGPLIGYCVVEEIATDELEITQHPVQTGAAITDHAYRKPTVLTVRGLYGPQVAPLEETYKRLLELQDSREPIDVVTGKRVFRSMLVKGLAVTEDAQTRNVVAFSCELQEVFLVSVETVKVPPSARHARPQKTAATAEAGKQQATPAAGNNETGALKAWNAVKGLTGYGATP